LSGSTTNVSIGSAVSGATNTLTVNGLPTYANEAAAVTGGLAAGMIYKTSTGEVRVKL